VTPPHAPGIPGQRLPETWEKHVADLERRVRQLEQDAGITRQQLHSYTDEEEDSQVKIPSDAPPKAKVALGALAGLTPTGRAVVILVLGLAAIAAATLLILRGVKLF
jgi:uncharacterized protein involved in exopolysaccharide biosynthesis